MFRSITWRLTFFYSFMLLLCLSLLGLFIYESLSYVLKNDALKAVDERANVIMNMILGNGEDGQHVDITDEELVAVTAVDNFLIQVSDKNGVVVNASPELKGRKLPIIADTMPKIISWQKRQLAYISVSVNYNENNMYSIQIAKDISNTMDFLHSLGVMMLISSVMALVLSLLSGFFIARQALRPVDTIVKTAQQIDARHMNTRIPLNGPVDEIYRLAQTLNDMFDRIKEAFDKQKTFVSDASHELRTPLAVIDGYTHLLLRWGKDDPVVLEESLQAIAKETRAMNRLVEDLLFLAREDRGLELDIKKVDLKALIEDVQRSIEMISDDIEVVLGDMDQVYINGDEHKLRQLLMILIDNGIKYNKANGRVILSLKNDGRQAIIQVEDSGIGISEEALPHIFERFYRVDKTRSRNRSGAGLGLAIAKAIVDAHRGSIEVASCVGKGTTFTIKFPVVFII